VQIPFGYLATGRRSFQKPYRSDIGVPWRSRLRAFDLTSIALWRDGRLGVSRNPAGGE